MIKTILLEGQTISESGLLTLQLDRQIEVNVPAAEAQRKVNHFVHMEISTQMHAEIPLLVISEGDAAWRIPIHLTFPALGDVGCAGYIFVDPTTGKINSSPSTIAELTANAEKLALRFTSSAAHTS